VADFTKIRDEYFKPLHDTILENVQDLEFANNLFTIVKKALSRLQNIEFNALEFAQDMEDLKTKTKNAIEFLDNQMKEIEQNIKI